jgi:hypothetical protein
MLEAYPRVEHLKGSSLGQALTLLANITLGWRGLPKVCQRFAKGLPKVCQRFAKGLPKVSQRQTLACICKITDKKKLIKLTPIANVIYVCE